MFSAIKEQNEKLYEKVVFQIKDKIAKGELQEGDKLPPERELTKMLNVSRSSVREAMKTLEVIGLVNIKHGQGIFIADKSQEKLIDLLKPFLFMKGDSIQNLFDIRKTLETQAAAWAASRGTTKEKESLEEELDQVIDKHEQQGLSEEDVQQHNNRFHYMVSAMSHNPILIRMMDTLDGFIDEIYDKTVDIPKRIDKSLEEHAGIVEMICKGDEEGARKLMMEHLVVVEDAFGSKV